MLRSTTLTLAILFTSALGQAQMSGTYTIDPIGSGPRNFPDFATASYELFMQGVSGPVDIQVAPGDYHQSWVLSSIAGSSPTNTVTFISSTPLAARVFRGNQGLFVRLRSTGGIPVQSIVFDGFEINAESNCHDIEIRNCLINDNVFAHNTVDTGPNDNQYSSDWRIHHNRFETRFSGLSLNAIDGLSIHHNEFTPGDNSSTIISVSSTIPSLKRTRIFNNLIQGQGLNGSAVQLGGRNIDLDHNTIIVGAQRAALTISGAFGMWSEWRNNIIVNLSGLCMEIDSPEPFSLFADHNIYWSPNSSPLVRDFSDLIITVDHPNLASWQAASGLDSNSLEVDPLFINDSILPYDLNLIATSPAIGAGDNLHPWVTDDFLGNARRNPPTIGAFELPTQVTFNTFGSGCAGNGGQVPVLGYSGSLDIGSVDFAITLSNANGGLTSKAFFAAGVSNTFFGGTPLPFDFGGGCSLLQSDDFSLLITVGGPSGAGNGNTSLLLGIPNDPNILGQDIHFQWGVVDAAAAGIGVAFSNGGTVSL